MLSKEEIPRGKRIAILKMEDNREVTKEKTLVDGIKRKLNAKRGNEVVEESQLRLFGHVKTNEIEIQNMNKSMR